MKKSSFASAVACLVLMGGSAPLLAAQSESGKPEDAAGRASDAGGNTSGSVSGPADEFARMDTNRDGRVSAAEYAASDVSAVEAVAAGKRRGTKNLQRGSNLPNSEAGLRQPRIFRRMDTDGDGTLSRSEWDAARRASSETRER